MKKVSPVRPEGEFGGALAGSENFPRISDPYRGGRGFPREL